MAAGRTLRSLVSRRRRAEDEGEDDDGPVFVEDSQSEGSVLTEGDEDEDVEAGSVAGNGVADIKPETSALHEGDAVDTGAEAKKARKPKKRSPKKGGDVGSLDTPAEPQPTFMAMADTEAMMNGLKVSDQDRTQEEVADFETMGHNGTSTLPDRTAIGPGASTIQQRREHEEYRKKRDSNPAFIPNRGNFFMHDTRGHTNGPAPLDRGVWQGRGRGRGLPNVGGPFSPANQMAAAEKASEQQWKHDLHDTINEEPSAPVAAPSGPHNVAPAQTQTDSSHLFPKPAARPQQLQPQTISFDSTTYLGTVQVRVFLPGMKAPVTFSEMPNRRYTRLPNHRPPLRRDKPVRVFVPGQIQRYIFPTTDRSFIFIPRQMRPNQQGFHRGYQRSVGGYGYSSRRTSMHGSMYSVSVAPSRRSSMAGVSRDRAFSPAGSFGGMPPGRPVVRMPHGSQHGSNISTPVGPMSGYHTPTGMTQIHTYPLPQPPQFQGTPTTTMYQPRPQKTISVTGIESPALLQQVPTEPQPFQNQLPAHMNEQPAYQQPPPPPYFSPRQQYQYPQMQPQGGTPLPGMPEQAIHAPSFQPPGYPPQPYYPGYPPQQGFYYSPPGPNGYPQMPMYMMPPQQGYMGPPPGPSMNPPQQPPPQQPIAPLPSNEDPDGQQSQSGMVAHESNGMVFYVRASEAQSSEQHYQPAEGFVPSYAMPGLPPPTPAPDSQMQYYYPQMPHPGMQEVTPAVYYPTQQ